jgi:hypothetical protein
MVCAKPFSRREQPKGAGRRAGIGGGVARRPCKVYRHACPADRSTRAGSWPPAQAAITREADGLSEAAAAAPLRAVQLCSGASP